MLFQPSRVQDLSILKEWRKVKDQSGVTIIQNYDSGLKTFVFSKNKAGESDDSMIDDAKNTEPTGMIRLRILKDMPEPILDANGEEIELLAGDSFNCHSLMAETLIAAGWAEAAAMD